MSDFICSPGPDPEEIHWTLYVEDPQRTVDVLFADADEFMHPDWKRAIRMMLERNALWGMASVDTMPGNLPIEMVTLVCDEGVIEQDLTRYESLPCSWIGATAFVVRCLQWPATSRERKNAVMEMLEAMSPPYHRAKRMHPARSRLRAKRVHRARSRPRVVVVYPEEGL